LTAAYATCPRYGAALDARRARWIGAPEGLVAFEARVGRRVPRVAPVALDRPSAIAGPLSLLGGSRRLARIALAAAMVGAAGLLLAARFAGGQVGGNLRVSPEPSAPAAVASPTEGLGPSSASPSLPATSTPSPAPAKTSKPTAKPASTRRYTVRSGDTLGGIARRFGTTVAVLKKLNGISDTSRIRPGRVLRIP
jgi:LysM repeat protein